MNLISFNIDLSSLLAEQQAVGMLRWVVLMWLISTLSFTPTSLWPLYPFTFTKPVPEERALRSSSMSSTLASRLLQAFSFSWSSFILLFMLIVLRVIFLPGLLILRNQ